MVEVGVMVTVGNMLTVIFFEEVLTQPKVDVPVTVYVVVADGLAYTIGFVVDESPVGGAQVKDAPPVTVSKVESPAQMTGFETVTETPGSGLTVT